MKRGWTYPLKSQEGGEGTPLKDRNLGALTTHFRSWIVTFTDADSSKCHSCIYRHQQENGKVKNRQVGLKSYGSNSLQTSTSWQSKSMSLSKHLKAVACKSGSKTCKWFSYDCLYGIQTKRCVPISSKIAFFLFFLWAAEEVHENSSSIHWSYPPVKMSVSKYLMWIHGWLAKLAGL